MSLLLPPSATPPAQSSTLVTNYGNTTSNPLDPANRPATREEIKGATFSGFVAQLPSWADFKKFLGNIVWGDPVTQGIGPSSGTQPSQPKSPASTASRFAALDFLPNFPPVAAAEPTESTAELTASSQSDANPSSIDRIRALLREKIRVVKLEKPDEKVMESLSKTANKIIERLVERAESSPAYADHLLACLEGIKKMRVFHPTQAAINPNHRKNLAFYVPKTQELNINAVFNGAHVIPTVFHEGLHVREGLSDPANRLAPPTKQGIQNIKQCQEDLRTLRDELLQCLQDEATECTALTDQAKPYQTMPLTRMEHVPVSTLSTGMLPRTGDALGFEVTFKVERSGSSTRFHPTHLNGVDIEGTHTKALINLLMALDDAIALTEAEVRESYRGMDSTDLDIEFRANFLDSLTLELLKQFRDEVHADIQPPPPKCPKPPSGFTASENKGTCPSE